MAKKQKLQTDDFDFDSELNFDDFDAGAIDSQMSPESKSTKRDPVQQVFKGTITGASSKLKDPSFLADLTRQAMPKAYGEIADVGQKVMGSMSSLYDESVRELKPQAGRLAKKIDKLIPADSKLKNLSTKAVDFFGGNQTQSDQPSRQQVEDKSIALAQAEVFQNFQQEGDKLEEQRKANTLIQDNIRNKQAFNSNQLLAQISDSTTRLNLYNEKVTQPVQRKGIESSYRLLFKMTELVDMSKSYFEVFKNQNEAIAKNTSLPEFVKIKNSERFKDIARTKFMDKIQGSFFGEGSAIDRGLKRISTDVGEYVKGIKEGLQSMGNAADAIEQMREMNEMLVDAGMEPLTAASMAGNMMGAKAAEWFGEKVAGKVRGKLEGHDRLNNALFNTAGKLSNFQGTVSDLKKNRRLQDAAADYGTVKATAANGALNILDAFTDKKPDSRIENPFAKSGQSTDVVFNSKTQISITDVIPGLLSRILREITVFRTGDTSTQLTYFDNKMGKFVSKKELGASITTTLKDKISTSGYGYSARSAVKELKGDTVLTDKQEKKVTEFVAQISAIPNMNFTPEKIIDTDAYRKLDNPTKKLVKTLLDAKVTNSPEKAKGQYELTKGMMGLRNSTPDVRGTIESMVQGGYGEILEEQKIVKRLKTGDYQIDEDAYLKMVRDHGLVTSDETKKEDINPLSPKRALDAIRKTKVYNWMYKSGQGDGGEHNGPMAQDVQKNMGNKAAPAGKKIDLTTMNGNNMAAIQELAERQDTLEAKNQPRRLKSKRNQDAAVESEEKSKWKSAKTPKALPGVTDSTPVEESPKTVESPNGILGIFKKIQKALTPEIKQTTGEPEKKPEEKTPFKGSILGKIGHDVSSILEIMSKKGFGGGSGDGGDNSYSSLFGSLLGKTGTLLAKGVGDGVKGGVKATGIMAKMAETVYDKSKGPVGKGFEKLMEGAGWAAAKALEVGQDVIFNKLPNGWRMAAKIGDKVREKFKEIMNKVTDIYVPGFDGPVLRASLMKAGYYRDSVTGKVISSMDDLANLKGDIIDKAGDVVLSIKEASAGMYDKNGQLVKTFLGKWGGKAWEAATFVGGKLKDALTKGVPKLTGLLTGAKEKLGILGGKAKNSLSGIEGFGVGFGGEKIYQVLVEIRGILRGEKTPRHETVLKKKKETEAKKENTEKADKAKAVNPEADKAKEPDNSGAFTAGNNIRNVMDNIASKVTGVDGATGKLKDLKDKVEKTSIFQSVKNRFMKAKDTLQDVKENGKEAEVLKKAEAEVNKAKDKVINKTKKTRDKVEKSKTYKKAKGKLEQVRQNMQSGPEEQEEEEKQELPGLQAAVPKYVSNKDIFESIKEKANIASGLFGKVKDFAGKSPMMQKAMGIFGKEKEEEKVVEAPRKVSRKRNDPQTRKTKARKEKNPSQVTPPPVPVELPPAVAAEVVPTQAAKKGFFGKLKEKAVNSSKTQKLLAILKSKKPEEEIPEEESPEEVTNTPAERPEPRRASRKRNETQQRNRLPKKSKEKRPVPTPVAPPPVAVTPPVAVPKKGIFGKLKGKGGALLGGLTNAAGNISGLLGGNKDEAKPNLPKAETHEEPEEESGESKDIKKLKKQVSELKKRKAAKGKKAFNDRDGDGRRDGSWEDRLDKQKEKDEEAKAKLPGLQAAEAKYVSDKDIFQSIKDKANGIMDGAKGMFGAAADVLGMGKAGGSVLGKMMGGIGRLIGLGGAATTVASGAATAAGAAGAASTAAGAAGAGATAARLGFMGKALRVGSIVRNVATVGALATGGASSVVFGALSAGLTAVGAVLSSPVVLGAIAVAATGYGIYRLYKYMNRDSVNDYEDIRMKQYGIGTGPSTKKYNHFMLLLEAYLNDGRVGYTSGKAYILDKKVDPKELLEIFGIDKEDKEGATNFAEWFDKRFKPFFLTHLTSLYAIDNKIKLEDVEKLKPEDKVKYLNSTSFESGPYSVTTSPFKDLPALNGDSTFALNAIKKLLVTVSKGVKADISKDKAPKVPPAVIAAVKPITAPSDVREPNLAPKPDLKTNKELNTMFASSPAEDGPMKESPATANTPDKGGPSSSASSVKVADGPVRDGTAGMQYLKMMSGVKIDSMNPAMMKNLLSMAQEYGEKTGNSITVTSGTRTTAEQEALFRKDPKKAARPGNSMHEFGLAIDINSGDLDILDDMGLMRKYGFTRPVGGETWHMEAAGLQPNIQLAKRDSGFATTAIESSLFKGGGGVGSVRGTKLGRRDSSVALALLDSGGAQTVKDKVSDMTTVAMTPAKPPARISQKAADKGTSITMASNVSAANDKDMKAAPKAATSMLTANTQSEKYSKRNDLVDVEPSSKVAGSDTGYMSDNTNDDPKDIKSQIAAASRKGGVDPNELLTFAAMESSLDPNARASGGSSAKGLYGFTDGTWNYQMQKVGNKLDLSPNPSPMNVNDATLMASEYFKTNRRLLGNVKEDVNVTDIYLAHFLGPNGARKFLKADPSAIAAEVMPQAAAANKTYFYEGGKALTVGEVYKKIDSKLSNKAKEFNISLKGGNTLSKKDQKENTSSSNNSQPTQGEKPYQPQRGMKPPSAGALPTAKVSNFGGPSTPKAAPFMPSMAGMTNQQSNTVDRGGVSLGGLSKAMEESIDIQEKQLTAQESMVALLGKIVENTQIDKLKEAFASASPGNPSKPPATSAPQPSRPTTVTSAIDLRRKAS